MTLTAREVAEITRLLEESIFDELHLEIDGLKLHLRRGSPAPPQMVDDSAAAAAFKSMTSRWRSWFRSWSMPDPRV